VSHFNYMVAESETRIPAGREAMNWKEPEKMETEAGK
jgi:hypothetical protein